MSGLMRKHPVIANMAVILVVAVLGIWIVYLSIALFTKHGRNETVPRVENMTYTQAISELHEKGLKVDIRDSLYREDVKPGYVIEQFPKAGSVVKPGRKVFLYINAVHPREVVIDDDNRPGFDAMKGASFREGMAKLSELGFKNIKVLRVLGDSDRIVKVVANGHTVKKMEKIPITAAITVEVYDGRLGALRDSLFFEEAGGYYRHQDGYYEESYESDEDSYSMEPAADNIPEPDEQSEEVENIYL